MKILQGNRTHVSRWRSQDFLQQPAPRILSVLETKKLYSRSFGEIDLGKRWTNLGEAENTLLARDRTERSAAEFGMLVKRT
jgi:hypothetical protein